ncbi:MAG: hypothetical protein IPM51_04455 [Sphingobacteriaceae bacterium]|nr:hypothetical protein [Sphingobacteriaceae bacterium]
MIQKNFNKLYWLLAFIVFVIICLRAFFIPFSHDEASTFFFYIQSDNFLPYQAHVYTNNHILNSALANLCYHIAGSHRFVLRLPNVFAFVLLAIGLYRNFKYMKTTQAKLVVTALFFLSINFLDFFQLCRGYGISMGLMLLGLSYLIDYFSEVKFKSLVLFTVFWQLALAANMILVAVILVLLCYLFVFQYKKKAEDGKREIFTRRNIILQLINFGILVFWIRFSFFYKDKGVLDYGVGDSYWLVTFQSLIELVFGSKDIWFQVIVASVYLVVFIFLMIDIWRDSFYIRDLFKPDLFYSFTFLLLVGAFFMQKKLLGVNYPEDRTGLFFFLFFGMALAFTLDKRPSTYGKIAAVTITIASLTFFTIRFNLSDFNTWLYHTMPKNIYDKLVSEYEKDYKLFTLGGHRVREMNYAFANYRGESVLNAMDNSEEMQMNCDYYYAQKREKAFYEPYYEEIAEDKQWDRVLLKRKEKIEHIPIFETFNSITVSGDGEFYDFKRLPDTTFQSHNPIEIEAELLFEEVPKPFNAFFVVSLNNGKNETVHYKRSPLNWLADDLNAKTKYFKLTTGNLPDTVRSFVVHIWNIDKQPIRVTLKSLKIYQLKGKGVDFKIPASYYPLIEKITKKPLL